VSRALALRFGMLIVRHPDRDAPCRTQKARERYPPFPQHLPCFRSNLSHTATAKCRRTRAPRRARKGTWLHPRLHFHRLILPFPLVSLIAVAQPRDHPSRRTIDYVFDGTSPPYAPSAQTNPVNLYAITKRDAELGVLGVAGARAAVLRVPILCVFSGP